MARAVGWTASAWSDLESIAEFIASDSPHYAAALVHEIRDAARSLAEFSERGRVVPELDDPSVRELIVGSYRLVYLLRAADVVILGVIHGARRLPPLGHE